MQNVSELLSIYEYLDHTLKLNSPSLENLIRHWTLKCLHQMSRQLNYKLDSENYKLDFVKNHSNQ